MDMHMCRAGIGCARAAGNCGHIALDWNERSFWYVRLFVVLYLFSCRSDGGDVEMRQKDGCTAEVLTLACMSLQTTRAEEEKGSRLIY